MNDPNFIDRTTGRPITDGMASPADDELDLTDEQLTVVANGIRSALEVVEILDERFGSDDAWVLVMRGAAATLKDVFRSNARPHQIAAVEAALGRKVDS